MRHMSKWRGMLGASVGVLAACAALNPVQQTIRSTTGTTLVRAAIVIDIHEVTQAAPRSGEPAVAKTGSPLPPRQRLRVQFEDGSVHDYETDAFTDFQIGERILVSDTHGKIRLSR